MLIPAPRLLWLAGAWLAFGLAASLRPELQFAWQGAGAGALLLAGLDALRGWLAPPPRVAREVRGSLPIGLPARVVLRLQGGGRKPRPARVVDVPPPGFEFEPVPRDLILAPDKLVEVPLRMRPLQRGEHRFGPIRLRLASPWRLWWVQHDAAAESRVRVHPDFAAFDRHAYLASSARALQQGRLRLQRRGEGMDFDQLREYRVGDSPRQIDWKASSRFDKLISREYRDERDQRVILLLDRGRRMGARDGELSHFDHVLDAVLLLARVALRHGDAVGLSTLGGPPGEACHLPPAKVGHQLGRILAAVNDLQPSLEASDFEQAAAALVARQRKRSLVVILTNLRDEDDASLLKACRLLQRHHLVLIASLRERALDEAFAASGQDPHSLAVRAVATDYRLRRKAALVRLRRLGVLSVDVPPEELASRSVSRYLEVKSAGRL